MTHEVFTIVAAVRPGAVDRLKAPAESHLRKPGGKRTLPFGKLPMLHFASFVVLHDPVQEMDVQPPPVLPDQLVFESCIDGPFEEYADALLHVGAVALHRIFSCCVDYTFPNGNEGGDEGRDEQRLEDGPGISLAG